MIRRPPRSTRTDTLVPYTTLFRSDARPPGVAAPIGRHFHPSQVPSTMHRLVAAPALHLARHAIHPVRNGQPPHLPARPASGRVRAMAPYRVRIADQDRPDRPTGRQRAGGVPAVRATRPADEHP